MIDQLAVIGLSRKRMQHRFHSTLVRVVLACLPVLLLVTAIPLSPSEASSITLELWIGQNTIQVNGASQAIDTAPFILEGRTMVPIRFISETLGAKVDWFTAERKVEVTLGGRVVDLWIDKGTALVDGMQVQLDVPPIIDDFRAFVPLRFVSESLGAQVNWDPQAQKVTISLEPSPISSAWPLFRRDPQRSGRSPFKGPAQAILRWQFTTGAAIDASPVIGRSTSAQPTASCMLSTRTGR
jgi:hypothetical protein